MLHECVERGVGRDVVDMQVDVAIRFMLLMHVSLWSSCIDCVEGLFKMSLPLDNVVCVSGVELNIVI